MEKWELLSQRLNWAIEQKLQADPRIKKITNAALAKIAGVSPPAVGYWFADTYGIDAEHARKLGEFLGVDPVWLEKNVGEPHGIAAVHYNAGEAEELRPGRYVAIVGIGQGGPDGYISIDDHSPGDGDGFIFAYSPDPNAYAIRVRGDSMRPRIKSGEYIVAEPTVEAQPGDDVVVKRKDGRALVKELLWVRDGEMSLGSINNGVPPITIPLSDIESVHRVAAIVPRGSALLKKN